MKKVNCQDRNKKEFVRVKIIKPPLVNTSILKQFVFDRTRALVL